MSQQSLKSALMGRKPTLGTPQGKPAEAKAAETPEPKKRKIQEVVDVKLAEGTATKKAAQPVAAVSNANPGETGPYSLWTGPSGDASSVLSPAFHPKLKNDEFPQGKPVGFALVSKALAEI